MKIQEGTAFSGTVIPTQEGIYSKEQQAELNKNDLNAKGSSSLGSGVLGTLGNYIDKLQKFGQKAAGNSPTIKLDDRSTMQGNMMNAKGRR